ncbi:pyridoxamine 5'-phosphate oxidase family protein [Tropicimonas sp. IMCC34043]|uniref:pyridoxamine 5'-phosphate oxidase family protein n=1 Tax=Tropicimonas sp. IMCC34043 TaxID=2248760 RepID=UPI000E26D3C8|nr:pyridoxamine 5'-phosphate oxidase family protein [Tropicimonas sp. IMCC34043]
MPDLDRAREAPQALVFDTLSATKAGMLWVPRSGQHPQPMAHHFDSDTGELWYIADRMSDLVAAVGQGAEARLTIVSDAEDVHLSLLGPLVQIDNPERLRTLWGPMTGAYFAGKSPDESGAILLRYSPREVALWASPRNPVVFALNALRAQASGDTEALGYHTVITLAA